jgi:hypothetical protein
VEADVRLGDDMRRPRSRGDACRHSTPLLSGDEISLFVTSTVQCQLDEHFVYLFSKDLTDFKKLSAT